MHAIIFNEPGGSEVLEYVEIETPEPGPGQVRIRVSRSTVNPADWKRRAGLLASIEPYVYPMKMGFETAGVVDKLGEGVTEFAVGDRVFGMTNDATLGQGSFAEYTCAHIDRIAVIPDGVSFSVATTIPGSALTAFQTLYTRNKLEAGQKVFINGGSGGVGSWAVQFARYAGTKVAATCSTPNVDFVKGFGVERVIDYRTEDVMAAVNDWAPEGVDFLLELAGFSKLPRALELVRPGGIFASVPTMDDDGDQEAIAMEAEKKGVIRDFSFVAFHDNAEDQAKIAELVAEGAVVGPEITEFPLTEAAKALDLVESNKAVGKIVLSMADL